MPPSYIRVRAVVWAYGRGQTDTQTDTQTHKHTDTQTRVTTIHFALSTTHAKCNKLLVLLLVYKHFVAYRTVSFLTSLSDSQGHFIYFEHLKCSTSLNNCLR